MKDQVHIRNAEAAHLARTLARQTGKTISDIVLDALRQYRPGGRHPAPPARIKHWRKLLREDRRRGMARSETPIEALYDKSTGLPA
jgi:hypothetical protein